MPRRKTRKPSRKVKAVAKKTPAKLAKKKAAKKSPRPKPVAPQHPRKAALHRPRAGGPRPAIRPKTAIGRNFHDADLGRNPANFQPLTPLSLLERAAGAFPDWPAIIHGRAVTNYDRFYERTRRLASALAKRGIGKGNTVAVMLSNTPPMLEAHYGMPMAGAVLCPLNTRLDPATLAFILDHSEAKLLITDREFSGAIEETLKLVKRPLIVIDYDDPEFPQDGKKLGTVDYEAFLAAGDPQFEWEPPADEWDAIALNYTSGTTGSPKGVVFHHRGAALMAYSNILAVGLGRHPVYLWTLPIFHCNGWCFPWTLSAVAGTHVCLRWVRAKPIYDLIADHGVTHLCGAPTVMSTIVNAKEEERRPLLRRVEFVTAAAPPPEATLAAMAEAGFDITHVYGLTETYGPAVVNEWHEAWDGLDKGPRAALKARQGVRYHALESLSVMNPDTMEPVPADGTTLGEVMFRGNIVMKGYFKNPGATREAFAHGWFHSGDLAVVHPDGYIQLKDRSKDIIISGGENISSIEVEDALLKHPAVLFAAVVAKPDEKWGETPCAFIERNPAHAHVSAADLIAYCRTMLAHYKCPRYIVFCELPKTSTGKIQKFRLREQAKLVN